MSDDDAVAIVGAGGLGREVLEYAQTAARSGWPYRIAGFLDDTHPVADRVGTSQVLGPFSAIGAGLVGKFIVALGDAEHRRRVAEDVASAGGTLVTLVHPLAHVSASAVVADGTIVCPFALVGAGSRVGSNVLINVYASVGHDARVGSHAVLSPYAALTGWVELGDESFVGTHATLAPRVRVGSRSKVSAGAVVKAGFPPGSLIAGSPARGRVMFAVADPADEPT